MTIGINKSWLAAVPFLLVGGFAGMAAAQEVNLYSSRHYDTDIALYENFTEQTGIKVNLIEGSGDELIQRIEAEGDASPADILITVDATRLWRAVEAGIFTAVESDILAEKVPANLRHPDNLWFGMSKRARVIYYNKDNGEPAGLESYEDLADPAFSGMICIRSSSNVYNQSLMASLIANLGEEAAEGWAKGVVANMAREPEGNDTAQIEAVAAGACDLAVGNSYYLGRLMASDDAAKQEIASKIGVIHPNQGDRGTHVNVSGAGVVGSAPNPEAAVAFLEYLVSDEAQRLFAEGNNEYPVVAGIDASGPISSLGSFKEDTVNAGELGPLNPVAVQVYDRAGWK
ncbi:MAG: Fe(3+) ABC transporter substrate-binding protein [Pseudomonadota bacterium]